ncbi:dihydrofolate reductase family protein [Peribacillus phoenicis]|uniref:dihydrofolate reductase family protein n=1 Tax=unclassified Peribacillus TaxID=2675266 RepID=UPI0039A1B071
MNEVVGDFIGRQKEGSRICLVGGAEIVSDFMRETQVDEMILSIIPIILGDGNRLLNQKLTKMQQYGQIAQLHYQREK